MKRGMRVVPADEVEAWAAQRNELARVRSRAAQRLWASRARDRSRRSALLEATQIAASNDASARLGEAMVQAQGLVTACSVELADLVRDALSAVLRGDAAAAWVRTALEDASARLSFVTLGELRVAPAQMQAAEAALQGFAAGGNRLPFTVAADAALAEGSVVVVSDAGKVVVELDALLAAVRQAVLRRYAAMPRTAGAA